MFAPQEIIVWSKLFPCYNERMAKIDQATKAWLKLPELLDWTLV